MAWIVTLAISIYGTANVMKYYGIPWLAVTHWVGPQNSSQLTILTPSGSLS